MRLEPKLLRDEQPAEGQHCLVERAPGGNIHTGKVIHAVWTGESWKRASSSAEFPARDDDVWVLMAFSLRMFLK